MISQQQFRELMKEYDQKKILAEQKAQNKLGKLYKQIPLLKTLDEDLQKIGLKTLKLTMSNLAMEEKEDALKELHDFSLLLKQKKTSLLLQNGYSLEDLKPSYECTLCRDTGYIENENYIKEKCNCLKNKVLQLAFEQSNIHKLNKENFSTFNLKKFRNYCLDSETESPFQNMVRIWEISENFIEKFDNISRNLLFIGQPGRGKTFLCNCIAKELIELNKVVLYFTANELIELFSKYRFSKKEGEKEIFQQNINHIYECDLLIIDDLGTEMQTVFSGGDIFNIINTRMIKRKKIILSTNLSLEKLNATYSSRLTSRLSGTDFSVLEFFGDDLRKLS